MKLIPQSLQMYSKSPKTPLPLQIKVTEKLEQMVRQDILEMVQPVGITNAYPVVFKRKKIGELRFSVLLKVHINSKVMDEDYPLPEKETIFQNLHRALDFGKIDLSVAYHQIELSEGAKNTRTINKIQ